MPDESRDVAYVSTCSDDRPIDHTHFMVLDLKTRTYADLGDMEHAYAFIVLDDKGRAYHPMRGGTVARYDPATKKLDTWPSPSTASRPASRSPATTPSSTGTRRRTRRRSTPSR